MCLILVVLIIIFGVISVILGSIIESLQLLFATIVACVLSHFIIRGRPVIQLIVIVAIYALFYRIVEISVGSYKTHQTVFILIWGFTCFIVMLVRLAPWSKKHNHEE